MKVLADTNGQMAIRHLAQVNPQADHDLKSKKLIVLEVIFYIIGRNSTDYHSPVTAIKLLLHSTYFCFCGAECSTLSGRTLSVICLRYCGKYNFDKKERRMCCPIPMDPLWGRPPSPPRDIVKSQPLSISFHVQQFFLSTFSSIAIPSYIYSYL